MINIDKKNVIKEYSIFNFIIVVLALCVILLPILTSLIGVIIPGAGECLTYKYFGRHCPLCGFTRDVKNIISGNLFAYKLNLISTPAVILSILEVVARISMLVKREKLNDNNFRVKVIKVDVIYHIIMAITFIIYGIMFYAFQLDRI